MHRAQGARECADCARTGAHHPRSWKRTASCHEGPGYLTPGALMGLPGPGTHSCGTTATGAVEWCSTAWVTGPM
jgi:hypothetical protein